MVPQRKDKVHSFWWASQMASIRHCYFCGDKLKRCYVQAEKQRRLVCIDCGQITYTNPKVVAGLIPVMPDGRVALLKRDIEPARGKWSFPAGYLEWGEAVEKAAVRETWEEIRARVKVKDLIGIYSYADAGVVTIVYVGNVLGKTPPQPGEESQEVKLFKPSKIPWKGLAFRSTIDALKDWGLR